MHNILLYFSKGCIRISVFPNFFQRLVAAHAVGKGSRAYREKHYDEAFKVLKPVADYTIKTPYIGSAQYIIGLMYLYGLSVRKDEVLANNYFSKAVENNHEDAKAYLKEQ